MYARSLYTHTATAVAVVFVAAALFACGGRQVPEHDGYRSAWDDGWEKAKAMDLDEDAEAEVDGELSYPKRRRVRWFSVEVPGDGELEISLASSPLGESVDEADEEDADDPFDVAFELYDSNYKQLLRAGRNEDDAGERKKTRTAYELRKGVYFIHVYLQRRLDEAEFTLRVKYSSGRVEPDTGFPKAVAFVDALPVVPALDDAPMPVAKPRKKCRGSKCRKKPRKEPTETTEPAAADTPDKLKARIIVVRGQTGGGTAITVNRGSNDGVAKGWKGKIVTKKGQSIPGGDFTIHSVKTNAGNGNVSLSPDAVKQAGYAILTPP